MPGFSRLFMRPPLPNNHKQGVRNLPHENFTLPTIHRSLVNINEHRNEINLLSAQYISDPDMLAAKLVEQVLNIITLMIFEESKFGFRLYRTLMIMSIHKFSSPGIPPVSWPSQKCQKTWKICQSVRALQWSFKREICQEHLHLSLPPSDPGAPRHDARVWEYLQDSLLREVPR